MLSFLDRWTLRNRLIFSFGGLLVLLIVMGGAGMLGLSSINQNARAIGTNWMPSLETSLRIENAGSRYRIRVLQHVLASTPDKMAAIEKELDGVSGEIQAALKAYEPLIVTDQERATFDAVRSDWAKYDEFADKEILPASREMRTDAALAAIDRGGELYRSFAADAEALQKINKEGSAQAVEESAQSFQKGWMGTGALLIFALLLGLVLAVRLLRAVMRQLGGEPADAQEIVTRMATGELDVKIPLAQGDERSLLAAMKRLQDSLQKFSTAQLEMGRRHDAGAISYRIRAEDFGGQFAELARTTNSLVDQHVQAQLSVTALVQEYATGDLRRSFEAMPGEKAALTTALEQVRSQLGLILDTIMRLSRAAAQGDFSQRGDARQFDHAFREIIEGLNALMSTSEGGLREVGAVMSALAGGDLSQRVKGSYQGRFAQLQDDTNSMVERLQEIVSQINESAEQVSQSARESATASSEMSGRTEQQAASLEETASSMEELTATVKQNADNAAQANQLAVQASSVAVQGGDAVSQVVETMNGIAESSRRISDITSSIDGIAFQTNILALNAAVEAARAGEQGRGFAVVAAEVRSLAQRAAVAAKEIKSLVDDSRERVEHGTGIVTRAGETMTAIVSSVKRVTDIMAEISAASNEQSAGINQVAQTVGNLDEMTQQNAAMVEQATSAARGLQEQAELLTSTVGFFRLHGEAARAPGLHVVRAA